MRQHRAWLVSALVLAAGPGCSFLIDTRPHCASQADCLPTQVCLEGNCEPRDADGGGSDAGAQDAGVPDAGDQDAGADAGPDGGPDGGCVAETDAQLCARLGTGRSLGGSTRETQRRKDSSAA